MHTINAVANFDRHRAILPSASRRASLVTLVAVSWLMAGSLAAEEARRPNILLVMADDLGYAEVGCYGQTRIRTPHVDRLARDGMRFTQFYSGNPVCAPSRCALLTGYHTGHAAIRNNKEMGGWGPDEPEGQWPIANDVVTVAERLKALGYATACIGKWGLGGPESVGHPNAQGFDLFHGYLCQRVAHNYFPTHLWHNGDKAILKGNDWFSAHQRLNAPPRERSEFDRFAAAEYACDSMVEEALRFIKGHRDEPFFLYVPTPVPHVALQVPEDSLKEYAGRFDEEPYLGQQGYLPHPEPRAAYAAMVTRMDRDFGRMLDLLRELGIADDTLVVFTSDNGPTFNGGSDSKFFDSTGGLRGLKASVYEGGVRVPCVVRWPGRVEPATVSDHVSAAWDLFPTFIELAGGEPEQNIDGLSLLPTLTGRNNVQRQHEVLYWELGRQQALRAGDWKLIRIANDKGAMRTELFNLKNDRNETRNLARERPEDVRRLQRLITQSRTRSQDFPSVFDAPTNAMP